MASQNELDGVYMQVAYAHSRLSKAVRAKVGCCIVTPSFTLLAGYNGTPSGYPNTCEYTDGENLVTSPYVVHAEMNAIAAAARTGVSLLGATAYITLSPCAGCAAVMRQVGITRVVYGEKYRDTTGLDVLESLGIETQFKELNDEAKKILKRSLFEETMRKHFEWDNFARDKQGNYVSTEVGAVWVGFQLGFAFARNDAFKEIL